MTTIPPTARREQVRRDLALVWSAGLLTAAGLALGVALLRPEPFWLVLGVFTACFLAPCIGLSRLLLGAGRRVQAHTEAHVQDSVESHWMDRAASGALFDTLAAASMAAGALSIFGWKPDAGLLLMGVVAFALADGALRYALLARREA